MYFHMRKIITCKKGSNEFEKNEKKKYMGRFEANEREWRNVFTLQSQKSKNILF